MSTKPDRSPTDYGERARAALAFDPEPARTLGPDERPTPGWVPMLGGVLLLVALAVVVARLATGASAPTSAAAASAATPSGDAPAVTAAPTDLAARPAPSGTATRTRPSVAEIREVTRRFRERTASTAAEPAAR